MAANLRVRLGLDSKGFQSGMARAKSSVKKLRNNLVNSFKGAIKQWGAMLGAAYVGMQIKETIEWGSRIRDLADQFGMTTKFVQQMDYAFKQTGTDGETAFKAIRKMMLKASVATNDLTSKMTKELLADAFGKLGVTMSDLKNKKPEDLFMQIAAAMQHADKSSADLHDALNVVFGKAGSQLLVTFNSDLAAMAQRLEDLGAIVEESSIRSIGAAGDKLEEFKTQNRSVWADIVTGGLTIFGGFFQFIASMIDMIAERLVHVGDGIMGMGSALSNTWDAIANRDMKALKRAKKEAAEAGMSMLKAVAGEEGTAKIQSGVKQIKRGGFKNIIRGSMDAVEGLGSAITPYDELLEVGDKMNERDAKSEESIRAKKELEALQKEKEEMAQLYAERMKGLEKIEELEEKQQKRKFDSYTPEQKLMTLMMKRVALQEKLNRLTKPMDDVSQDARLANLEGKEKEVMLQQLEEEKLAYMEAQEAAALAVDEEAKVQKEVDKKKSEAKPELAGGLKDTQQALQSIGGQIGGKNPLIDIQKASFEVQKGQHQQLASINQTLTQTFSA